MHKSLLAAVLGGIATIGAATLSSPAPAAEPVGPIPDPTRPSLAWNAPILAAPTAAGSGGVLDAAKESLFGDVYADPSRWRPLTLGTFFSEGWTQPWVSPPTGEGGAPRQGWINAFDGVFYRLGILTGGYAEKYQDNGNLYTSGLTVYTPFSARHELRIDVPFLASNRRASGDDYNTNFGDLQLTSRFLLSEDRNTTQSFNVTFRMPTGSSRNGNGVAAVSPTYEFWTNPWRGLVVRGGAGMSIPYSNLDTGARTAFVSNLAVGYYCTPHELTPFGDLVVYLATNLNQPTDRRGNHHTAVTLTPGFRSHLGDNWYLLGGVEVPVSWSDPRPFAFQALGGLMKVF